MIMPSTRYTSLCNICLQDLSSDSLQCACCLTQVHQRYARLNDAIINSSNVDDSYWNCKDCIELSSILSVNDNNSTNVTFDSTYCSSFYNVKVVPGINFRHFFNVNTSYFTTEQFASNLHDAKGISIIHINCRACMQIL